MEGRGCWGGTNAIEDGSRRRKGSNQTEGRETEGLLCDAMRSDAMRPLVQARVDGATQIQRRLFESSMHSLRGRPNVMNLR